MLQNVAIALCDRLARASLSWLSAAALVAFLVACGGGGGSGGAADTVPAAITAQPSSVATTAGSTASFIVTATGDGLTYQWQRSTDNAATWTAIPGATAAVYTIAPVDVTLNGTQYRVTVTAAAASPATSSAATLTVTPAPTPPSITVQPAPQSVSAGANASFSVTAAGTALAYQWESSPDGTTWSSVAGATSATVTLVNVALSDSGKQYRVVIRNDLSSLTSNATQLTVTAASGPPMITAQPASASTVVGQTAGFVVTAVATPVPTFQWQVSTDAGATFSDIAGAIGTAYTTGVLTLADNGSRFRVVVSNPLGTVNSNAATLTVASATAPTITLQPAEQVAYVPTTDFVARTAQFTVSASGNPTPNVQWQISRDGGTNFININGATGLTYTTPVVSLADHGSLYRVLLSNVAGNLSSRAAQLSVVNIGTGGVPWGLAIRPTGEILATVYSTYPGYNLPDASSLNGVRVVSSAGTVTTLAGSTTTTDVDGQGAVAGFRVPNGVALDAAGNAYIATSGTHVRKVTPGGAVSTLAGSGTPGFIDGNGAQASFKFPYGVAVDAAGNVYVADNGNYAIRKISPMGDVTTLAGGQTTGTGDGMGPAAQFLDPRGLATDGTGNLYVAEPYSCRIRKVSPAGAVSTVTGTAGCADQNTQVYVDGPTAVATFLYPSNLAVDAAGNIFVVDSRQVRKISAAGVVSTLPGPAPTQIPVGTAALLGNSIAVDAAGNVYVGETWNYSYYGSGQGFPTTVLSYPIRRVTPSGQVSYVP